MGFPSLLMTGYDRIHITVTVTVSGVSHEHMTRWPHLDDPQDFVSGWWWLEPWNLCLGYYTYTVYVYIYIHIWLVVSKVFWIFHFIYGMSSFPLTNSIIFQRGRSTTNQIFKLAIFVGMLADALVRPCKPPSCLVWLISWLAWWSLQ